ncbi:MarR family winged helix-turn-helix transcriptional regulator [Pontivivens ytuae]|uniref:MarR family transcriptional regulator n=1 Tax=Pontivivens ytuae TaxID=2789856 RepID=A0A7S9QDV6_9RHOB|nr:MarR family transcriptional regulator [Pontivivens ytuae]QPH55388.1 MarR family transcriptional regulator [Pontivivens ytuae]
MTENSSDPLAIALLSEIDTLEQLARGRLQRALPKGMELSQFAVLNHFARLGGEKTPAQLARVFHVTKGTMTNTLKKLEVAGWVHIRPDWEDGRKKWVTISPAGRAARDYAVQSVTPVFEDVLEGMGRERIRAALPFLRDLRTHLSNDA